MDCWYSRLESLQMTFCQLDIAQRRVMMLASVCTQIDTQLDLEYRPPVRLYCSDHWWEQLSPANTDETVFLSSVASRAWFDNRKQRGTSE